MYYGSGTVTHTASQWRHMGRARGFSRNDAMAVILKVWCCCCCLCCCCCDSPAALLLSSVVQAEEVCDHSQLTSYPKSDSVDRCEFTGGTSCQVSSTSDLKRHCLRFFGRSRSYKVEDFGTNRKRVCDFLLVINSNFGPILHRDTATYWLKIAYFFYPCLIRRPRSLGSLWNFALKLTMRQLESLGYPPVKTHDRSLSRFDTVPACDGQTDGQTDTDRFTIANTALCIASHADAL